MTTNEEHDDKCEADWIAEAAGWTACGCADRAQRTQDIADLADGLRDAASTDDSPSDTPAEAWQQVTRYAFARAEIEITEEQFERAWRVAWQRAFMGGNYTADARAILNAAFGEGS